MKRIIESTSGGFKFPDGTVQTTAVSTVANGCTAITYLPYVIEKEGIYCLTGNLSTSMTSGNAIEVKADNVTIDLKGWKLDGSAVGQWTQTHGIYASGRKNIIIRNGTIRGFVKAVYLYDASPFFTSKGHLVEAILADSSVYAGIHVQGRGIIVRRNRVIDTGEDLDADGIIVVGSGIRVIDNDISYTSSLPSFNATGITISVSSNCIAENNRIENINAIIGSAYGIFVSGSTSIQVVGNRVSDVEKAIYFSSTSTGEYRGNITTNVTTAYTGGTDVGNND
jgi:nitrous oxidase accessory protein NosD